jgi:hypothetical protein
VVPRKSVSSRRFFCESLWYDSGMPLIYLFTLIIGLQFLAVDLLAEHFSLYWRYDWLDMPVHACGGIVIALSLSSLVTMAILPRRLQRGWPMVLLVATILIGWEIFGIYRDHGFKVGWLSDTSSDLLCGALGFMVGRWFTKLLDRLA